MGIRFSADEAFELAERIESNGADFYRKAAQLHRGGGEVFLELAQMEDQHRETFEAMRAELSARMRQEVAFDPFMEATSYLEAMADAHGGEGTPSAADCLTGAESLADILRTAVELEGKSIVFYVGLRDMVPPSLGQERVQAIIDEEKSHVVTLAAKLRSLPVQ